MLRDARYPRRRPADRRTALLAVGRGDEAADARVRALAADVYWIRAIQHYGGERLAQAPAEQLRPAVSAPRPHDVARSVFHDRLPLRRDFPQRAVSRRTRAARSGDRAAREGDRGAAARSGSPTTTSRSSITGTCATPRPRPTGFSAPPSSPTRRTGCSRWRPAMLTPASDRASARLLWGRSAPGDQELAAADRRTRACGSSTRSMQIDQLQQIVSQFPPSPGERYSWELLIRRRRAQGHSRRSRRRAVPDRSVHRPRRRRSRLGAATHAARSGPQAPVMPPVTDAVRPDRPRADRTGRSAASSTSASTACRAAPRSSARDRSARRAATCCAGSTTCRC